MQVDKQLQNFALNTWHKRKQIGLSQQKLADQCGIDVHTLQYIEWGKNAPNLRTAIKIAHRLDMPIQEMLKPVKEE